MLKILVACMFVLAGAFAQTGPASTPPTAQAAGSISGVVRDAGTGAPMPEVEISANPGKRVETTTDAQGRYEFRSLAAGTYRVRAAVPWGPFSVKVITLNAGQDLASVDFHLRAHGEISGKILDENKEPIPGISVLLIAREYSLGALRHVFAGMAETDDRGEYRLQHAEPGRGYLVLAEKRQRKIDAISAVPADPKVRKSVPIPTYYPDSPSMEGAQAIVLRAGERRQGMDIQMPRGPSYCIDGTLEAEGRPAALYFDVGEQRPTSGASGDGAVYIMSPNGTAGPDGKIRICDLHPGDYHITAAQNSNDNESAPSFFGGALVTISDRDVHDIKVGARARVAVSAEVVWHGAPPEQPVQSKISLWLQPLTRAPWSGESMDAKSAIPGGFSLAVLLVDDYDIKIFGIPSGAYLKDLTYGGVSILHEPFRVGSAVGNAGLRLILARDGGVISAKVADKDGNPVADSYVFTIPESASSEPMIAATMLSGQTDQNGSYSTKMLAPGKYYVLASTAPIDLTPESITRLSQARSRAQEVEVSPNATLQVSLAPAAID